MPTGVIDKVQDISKTLSEKIKSGQMNLSEMNPLTLGSMVMSQISQDEMQDLSKQVMGFMNSDPQNMFRLLNSMQSMMPAGAPAMPQMGELGALLGNLDLASLMKSFGPKWNPFVWQEIFLNSNKKFFWIVDCEHPISVNDWQLKPEEQSSKQGVTFVYTKHNMHTFKKANDPELHWQFVHRLHVLEGRLPGVQNAIWQCT